MILSIDAVNEFLDSVMDFFPPVLFEDLNGGICLLEDAKADPEVPGEPTYIMGEYYNDPMMGKYINIYYGSFVALAAQEEWSQDDWENELYTTLSHEITHHVEGRAGVRDLEIKDAEELARWQGEEDPHGEE